MKLALFMGLSLGSSVCAYTYTVLINPDVQEKGVNLTFTKKILLSGWEDDTFPTTAGKKEYDTAGICLWGSEFILDGGDYAGEKVEVRFSGNICSNRTLTLGLKKDFEGESNVFVGNKGTLAVRVQG